MSVRHPHLFPLPFYGEGTHLHHIHDPAGILCEPHHHLYHELDYVLNGAGVFAVGARKVEVAPGDLVYLARGVYHWRTSDVRRPLELCNLTLADLPLRQYLEGHPDFEAPEWPWWRHWQDVELSDAASRKFLAQLVRQMRRRTGPLPSKAVSALLPGVVELLVRDRPGGAPGPDLRALAGRIRHRPEQRLRLDVESDRVGVSRWWLSRVFKRRYALTLWEYRNYARADLAIHRLLTSDVSIGELARALGFSGTTQFITTFKRLVGVTPARFRRKYRNRPGHEGFAGEGPR